MKGLVAFTVDTYEKLDFAHNNAGRTLCHVGIGDADSEAFDTSLKITLYSTFYGLKHQVNAMLKNGGGSIVNRASTEGIEDVANMPDYVASKHGVVGLIKSAAIDTHGMEFVSMRLLQVLH